MPNEDAVSDSCQDVLCLGDGLENTYAFACMLELGHDGPHCDEFEECDQLAVIVWHYAEEQGE